VAGFGARYASCRQQARLGAADWLRRHTGQGTVFSISDAGLVPALADGRTAIDQFMLNDPTLQTRGRVPAERRVSDIYGRRPDVLVLVSSRPDHFVGLYPPDRGMARNPGFSSFRFVTVSRGRGVRCAYHLFLYARR
jgi:arabinofuranosyltransferase